MINFQIYLPQHLHSHPLEVRPNVEFELGKRHYFINGEMEELPSKIKPLINKDIQGYKYSVLKKSILVTLFEKNDVLEV